MRFAMPTKAIRPIRIEGNLAFIPLTQGYTAVIDADDVPLVESWNWHAHAGWRTVYAVRPAPCNADGKRQTVFMHRAIMSAPDGMEVDHIDGNGLDNRRSTNLRLATRSQNQHNQGISRANTSGFKGVTWSERHKKWRVLIAINSKLKHLGYFTEKNLAAAAYAKASAELHGEFGRLS
jgi:hypothetical protein